MTDKERFIEIYNNNIKREGSSELLQYLMSPQSDFFQAPASTKYHSSYAGGLLRHSLNVYDCLCDLLSRPRAREVYRLDYSDETIAIISLLHDLCKVNIYTSSTRNVKDENGTWQKVPVYMYDDRLPYGHGEKSVYIISGFMKLTRDEAFAIRYHMGFSEEGNQRNIGLAFEEFPLVLALATADMEATYYLESDDKVIEK